MAIAHLAEAQHAVVARRQLAGLGLSDREIDYRISIGRLHRIHRGVYSVGHRLVSLHGRWMAAVLAGGPGAVLSHRSASGLHRVLASVRDLVEVTIPRKVRSRPGLVFHRAAVPPDEVDRVEGIPVTGVSRTLLDLAAREPLSEIHRALHEAEVLEVTDRLSLDALLARYPSRAGVAKIRAALANRRVGAHGTRSELEGRFLAFLAEWSLPAPEVNARLNVGDAWLEVDCLWRKAGLVAELDGRQVHDTADAFEQDRRRDRALQAAGLRVVRVTWRHLHGDADALAGDLRALLSASGRP